MPLYEYRCSKCSTAEYDRIHNVQHPIAMLSSEIKCPDCDTVMARQVTNVAYVKVN